MPFFRIIQHLLPRAKPWRLADGTQIRQFFQGLADACDFEESVDGTTYYGPRTFFDLIWYDLFADTTRELEQWEREFGLFVAADDTESMRRANLDAEWQAQGAQDPAYIQEILQTAGFELYVHEWWSSGHPFVARDPRNYADQAKTGTITARNDIAIDPNQVTACEEKGTYQATANNFLGSWPRYLVNEDLSQRAPPPLPDDPSKWPYFIYIGPATLLEYDPFAASVVSIPTARQYELKRLLLKLCPAQQWIVLMVDWIGTDVFDDSFDDSFE